MNNLKLALDSRLPMIRVTTDDVINVQQVLSHIANLEEGKNALPIVLPLDIVKIDSLQFPNGEDSCHLFYTSSECHSLAKLYRHAVEKEITIVFVNVERDPLYLEGGVLVPPRELIQEYLKDMGLTEGIDELLPALGGLTLKDIAEIVKMTYTRDEKLSVRGINETRRGYKTLQGISQVDTVQNYYVCPPELDSWLKTNESFFNKPLHPSLTPRGLLFDGPPGTGKTLASKHIASTFGVPLYRLDLGAMMGKYVGDSEGNLNAALAQIDEVEPCVVILDEVEKVFQSVGDSGVTSRMLSQLLWWLQEHKSKVFTVMTTNDMLKIPLELYREGRIDKTMAFMGLTSFDSGYTFAKGAFENMLKDMDQPEATADVMQRLSKSIKSLFTDGVAVPQTKVTQQAYAMVREYVTELNGGPVAEATVDLAAPAVGNVKVLKIGKTPA